MAGDVISHHFSFPLLKMTFFPFKTLKSNDTLMKTECYSLKKSTDAPVTVYLERRAVRQDTRVAPLSATKGK